MTVNAADFAHILDLRMTFKFLVGAVALFVAGFLLVAVSTHKSTGKSEKAKLWKTYLTWMIIAVFYSAAVIFGKVVFAAFILVISLKAVKEFAKSAKVKKAYYVSLLVAAVTACSFALIFKAAFFYLPLAYFLALVAIGIFSQETKNGLRATALCLFVFIWVPFQISFLLLLTSTTSWQPLMLLAGTAIATSDVFAYFSGKLFQNIFPKTQKIAERVNPNKTWLGASGNFIGALVGVFATRQILPSMPINKLVIIALVISFASLLGGLINSFVKRNLKIKDFSSALPGHGGFIDRIDSLLTSAVALYFFHLFFGL